MFQLYQEYETNVRKIPKLSQTSLYIKFDETSDISKNVMDEIKNAKEHVVMPDDIQDVVSMIRLNGDSIVGKAVEAYKKGELIVVDNQKTSKVPNSLPFIIMTGKSGSTRTFIFTGNYISNIKSSNEYTNLMALLEGAYLATEFTAKPELFLMNRQLVLTLCNIYVLMATAPLEQRLYIKGDNLDKILLYTIFYFYRLVDGENMNETNIPYKRLLANNNISQSVVSEIANDVKSMEDDSFITLLNLMKKINPVRYKDMDSMYMSYFTTTCGIPLIFALENISYLFMLVASVNCRSKISSYGLNNTAKIPVKKAISIITGMNLGK